MLEITLIQRIDRLTDTIKELMYRIEHQTMKMEDLNKRFDRFQRDSQKEGLEESKQRLQNIVRDSNGTQEKNT